MAYVLSLPPQSPLKRSFSETPYLHSTSPSSNKSLDTVRHCRPTNLSATSLITLTSVQAGLWLKTNENAPPKVASASLLDLINDFSMTHTHQNTSRCFNEKTLQALDIPLPPSPHHGMPFKESTRTPQVDEIQDSQSTVMTLQDVTKSDSDSIDWPIEIPYVSNECSSVSSTTTASEKDPNEVSDEDISARIAPFKRWVSILRRRNKQRNKMLTPRSQRWVLYGSETDSTNTRMERSKRASDHQKSTSLTSSLGFVTAVKSASITLAGTSIAPLSRFSTRHSRGRDSNRGSGVSDARYAGERGHPPLAPLMDERVWERAKHRRRTLEEIIASEEGYIGDMKVLVNVYITVLASTPSVPIQTRLAIHRNVSQILQLHEDILGELHRVVPNSEYIHDDNSFERIPKLKHVRWHSVDIVPGRVAGIAVNRRQQRHSMDVCQSPDPVPIGLTADTKTVADVAGVFDKYMKRFFAYEEYSAQFESVSQELEATYRTIPAWNAYERGIEVLSCTASSVKKREASCKKGLTLADLLIKPIQRPAKYPLFFNDLLKHTPVADDPVAHAELEKVYYRLKDANQEINNAKDDPIARRLIETTWLLQDRLVFSSEHILPRVLLTRLLGHVVLCGVLHVTYQTNERIEGRYMICILFKSCFLLATVEKGYSTYHVIAAITLGNGSIEEPNNGRGLQCHTAPYTWKLVFEAENRFYEIILSGCSAQEEDVWKSHLRTRVAAETNDLLEGRSSIQEFFCSLTLDLKSIGPAFGLPNSFTRRISIKRAATLGPKMNLNQVILKNTHAQKSENAQSAASLAVGRSQSHLSTGLVPILAPRRAERVRLENAICDVWTKDALPFPGMGPRRAENPIRASANSVMRKLSMASIASNFSKRSGSYASLSQLRKEDHPKPIRRTSPPMIRKASLPPTVKRPVVVDFHTAPTAFLPADFELKATNNRRRRHANRAMVFERATERMFLPVITSPTTSSTQSTPATSGPTRKQLSTPLASAATPNGPMEVGRKVSKPETVATIQQEHENSSISPGKNSGRARTRLFRFWTSRSDSVKATPESSKGTTASTS